jgi:hypothetical protein
MTKKLGTPTLKYVSPVRRIASERISVKWTETATWKRTLGQEASELRGSSVEAVERLRNAYVRFRGQVEPLAADIALSVPNYTDHSIAHSDALWSMTDCIVGDGYPLNPVEAFILGGTFLVHDLAMGVVAYENGAREIAAREDWHDFLASRFATEWESLNKVLLDDLENDPTWNGISDSRIKTALTAYLRDHHADQADKVMSTQWRLSNGEPFHLLADTELRVWYGRLIGRLARSHWQDVEDLRADFGETLGAAPSFPEWTVDPLKIACILRTADAAQIDSRRADPLHTPFRFPQGESRDHWLFQERMLLPQLVADRLVYTSSTEIESANAHAWWLAFDTIQAVDGELRQVDALLADLGRPRFSARSVAGAETSARLAKFIQTDAWQPIDARPRISQSIRVMQQLGGSALYGNSPRVAIRELLANAVDATRLKRAAYGDEGVRPVRISLLRLAEHDTLSVRDYGIGMSDSDLVNNLCDFGSSGWLSHSTRASYPGALASGFRSTGQFGIGFFSCFMAGQHVRVVTRSIDSGAAETLVLDFQNGLDGRPLLRIATRAERMLEPGTEVQIVLNKRIDEARGLLGSVVEQRSITKLLQQHIRSVALACEEAIELHVPTEQPDKLPILTSESWKTMPASGLADLLAPDEATLSERELHEYRRSREAFEHLLRPLNGVDGAIQGRLAIAVGRIQQDEDFYVRSFKWPGGIYCGGFSAASLSYLSGVVAGFPNRAARDEATPLVTADEFRRWFLEQSELTAAYDLSERDRANLVTTGVYLRVPIIDGPFLGTEDCYISVREFVDRAKSLDVIHFVHPYSLYPATRNGRMNGHFSLAYGAYVNIPHDTFVQPTEGSILVSVGNEEFFGWPGPRIADDEVGGKRAAVATNWWASVASSIVGEVVRQLSSAWGLSIAEILRRMIPREAEKEQDNRIEVVSETGDKIRVSGITFTKNGYPTPSVT